MSSVQFSLVILKIGFSRNVIIVQTFSTKFLRANIGAKYANVCAISSQNLPITFTVAVNRRGACGNCDGDPL
jgi:hypothetical protein